MVAWGRAAVVGPLLLGALAAGVTVAPTAKFFVLDPPREVLTAIDVGFRFDGCQEFGHMYSFEVYFPDFLRENPHFLAPSAEEADFVVLPHCTTYVYHLYRYRYGYGKTVEDCWDALRMAQTRYLLPLIEWAKTTPAHAQRGGSNFLIVYSMDKGRVDYPMASEATSRWRALSTVGNGTAWLGAKRPWVTERKFYPPEWFHDRCGGSLEKKRRFIWYPQDVVLPVPTVFHWTNRSSITARSKLVFFAGTPNSCLRRFVVESLEGSADPEVSVFREAMDRHVWQEKMYDSRFCLVPDGFSAISARLYEVIAHGCVPVIISEAFHPPMESLVDFQRFAVFVRPGEVPFVDHILRDIPGERYAWLHANLERVALLFDMESITFWTAALHAIQYG